MRIMVVDDAVFMRLSVRQMLEQNGYEVVGEAENGREAVIRAQELRPDVITMDITMPEMNGIEAVKRIMERDPKIKIIMCSAMGQEILVREAVMAGARSFIVKPFKAENLVSAIKKLA